MSTTSIRLNRIANGQTVELRGFSNNRAFATAKLKGWYVNGTSVSAPPSMKEMDANITVLFEDVLSVDPTVTIPTELELVRKPGTYGAMFRTTVKAGGTAYERVTAYAPTADIEAARAAKPKRVAKPKATVSTSPAKKEVDTDLTLEIEEV